jgi:riboflavin transporter FmnP
MKEQKKEQTTGAGTDLPKNNTPPKGDFKRKFSAKRLAFIAVFAALSYAVSFLEIPLFPATPYLKLDFGNAFILLVSFLLGPIEGIVTCVLKEGLRALGSSSGGVGEIANIAATTAYIILPSTVYRFRKGLKAVIPCLVLACFIGTGAALLTNRFITFPLYMGEGARGVFQEVFWFIVAFNFIKTAAVGIITMLLYKRLSNFLKRMKI